MSYTDLSTEFDYKDLLVWQRLDELAENDALFQARFTGDATTGLIPGPLRVTNNVFVKWRNNANSADVDGIKLNTSDQVEIGTTLKNPTLDADPTANLEASTKQYVDAGTMKIGLVARVSASTTSASLVDVLNITVAGRLLGILTLTDASNGGIKTIIDGVDYGELDLASAAQRYVSLQQTAASTAMFEVLDGTALDIQTFFKTSLQIQHHGFPGPVSTTTTYVIYERSA